MLRSALNGEDTTVDENIRPLRARDRARGPDVGLRQLCSMSVLIKKDRHVSLAPDMTAYRFALSNGGIQSPRADVTEYHGPM